MIGWTIVIVGSCKSTSFRRTLGEVKQKRELTIRGGVKFVIGIADLRSEYHFFSR